MGLTRIQQKQRIKKRVRKSVIGTEKRPRLSVYRSNSQIYVQIIDDSKGETLVAASSKDKDFEKQGTKVEIAFEVGKIIAQKAMKKGIELISFDRGSALYHGRVKSLAQGAREEGLKF